MSHNVPPLKPRRALVVLCCVTSMWSWLGIACAEQGLKPVAQTQRARHDRAASALAAQRPTSRQRRVSMMSDSAAPVLPKIHEVAPSDAVMVVAVDSETLRHSPHRRAYQTLVESIPDYHRVTGETGLDPLAFFDRVLVSSSDYTELTETMLIGRTQMTATTFKKHVDAATGESLKWTTREGVSVAKPQDVWWVERGDPRLFAMPTRGVVAFARPSHLKFLARRSREVEARRGRFFPDFPTTQAPGDGATLKSIFLMELRDIKSFALTGPATGLKSPIAAQVAAYEAMKPLVRARLVFATPKDAAAFARSWPGLQREMADSMWMRLSGWSATLANIRGVPDGPDAFFLEVRLEPTEVARIAATFSQVVAQQYARDMPPRASGAPASKP